MAYLKNVLSNFAANKDDIAAFFAKGDMMKGHPKRRCVASKANSNFSNPCPARFVCSMHISCILPFMDKISYPFYVEKNIRHKHAKEETYNHTSCLGLGEHNGVRFRKNTRVFTFTFVCKGTSYCRASPCGRTSKRSSCGYGTRLYALNGRPDIVIVEEFGAHNDELGSLDMGFRLQPIGSERKQLTTGVELQALTSFTRGLSPAKHLTYCSEVQSVNMTTMLPPQPLPTLPAIQNAYRRFRRITHTSCDLDGVRNMIESLEGQKDEFIVEKKNLEGYTDADPLMIFICVREICLQICKVGCDIVGLDATWGVTSYDFALFAVMGRSAGGALPLAYFITSSKSAYAVSMGLLHFKKAMNEIMFDDMSATYGVEYALDNFQSYSPAGFCIDKDDAENLAIRTVFPTAIIILCHFHVMVIFVNEVRAERHNLDKESIFTMMNHLRELCSSTTVEAYTTILCRIKSLSSTFHEYLNKNFLNARWVDTFSEYNRQHLPLSVIRLCRSNMLVEVSFKTLKYVILGGFHNKRLDDLVYIIAFRVFPYFLSRQKGVTKYQPRFHVPKNVAEEGTLLER